MHLDLQTVIQAPRKESITQSEPKMHQLFVEPWSGVPFFRGIPYRGHTPQNDLTGFRIQIEHQCIQTMLSQLCPCFNSFLQSCWTCATLVPAMQVESTLLNMTGFQPPGALVVAHFWPWEPAPDGRLKGNNGLGLVPCRFTMG